MNDHAGDEFLFVGREAGHDVRTLARAQDGAGGFTDPAHLRALAPLCVPQLDRRIGVGGRPRGDDGRYRCSGSAMPMTELWT